MNSSIYTKFTYNLYPVIEVIDLTDDVEEIEITYDYDLDFIPNDCDYDLMF